MTDEKSAFGISPPDETDPSGDAAQGSGRDPGSGLGRGPGDGPAGGVLPLPAMAARFLTYVHEAEGRTGIARLVLGLAILAACWIASTAAVLAGVVLYGLLRGEPQADALARLGALIEGGHPASVALMLATFAGVWPALWLVQGAVHREPVRPMLAPEGRPRWRDAAVGAWMGALFYALSLAIAVAIAGLPEPTGIPPLLWAVWAVPVALLVVVQAGAEELVFRGYLLRHLARLDKNPLLWGVTPALVFGALHYSGDLPGLAGLLYPLVTFLFGVTAAILVWRTGAISAAIGLHVAVNAGGLLAVGLDGVVVGSQPFLYETRDAEALLIGDAIASAGLLVFALSRWCPLGNDRADPDPEPGAEPGAGPKS